MYRKSFDFLYNILTKIGSIPGSLLFQAFLMIDIFFWSSVKVAAVVVVLVVNDNFNFVQFENNYVKFSC